MKGDIIYEKQDYRDSLNERIDRAIEAERRRSIPLDLSCEEVNGQWGIRMILDGESLLVSPCDLTSSVYTDGEYQMLSWQEQEKERYLSVEVRREPYGYTWRVIHSNEMTFREELRFMADDYVAKAREMTSLLLQKVKEGGKPAYHDYYDKKEGIRLCNAQLLVTCTLPSFYTPSTNGLNIEGFRFSPISHGDGEHYSIGIGERIYNTWFSHLEGDLELVRHQLETITMDDHAEVILPFDMERTIVKLEKCSLVDVVTQGDEGTRYSYRHCMKVTIVSNWHAHMPTLVGYCEEKEAVRTFYEGLLRLALDHPAEEGHGWHYCVPKRLVAYNMIKSALIEDWLEGKAKKDNNVSLRQRSVRHILTVCPDYQQYCHDEEGVAYDFIDGYLDGVYGVGHRPVSVNGLQKWQKEIEPIVIDSETGHPVEKDWQEYHDRGIRLARVLRGALSADYDLWYEAPFEDKSGIVPEPILIT